MQASKLLKGIGDWKEIIEEDEVQKCLDQINESNLRPSPDDIFNAFRKTQLSDVKVVLVGMDPYPGMTKGKLKAHGLSFSTRYETKCIPASLRNVYKALIKSGFMKEMPDHGCLENWTKQGVLLLNIYLTTGPKPGMHKHIWEDFSINLIKKICEIRKPTFMLWGKNAEVLKKYISSPVLIWGHPSPMSRVNNTNDPRSFINCDHFRKVPIIWNPNWNPDKIVVCFTDGHSRNNGKSNATAGYGVYFPVTFAGKENKLMGEIYGPVSGTQTNNRAELTAIIKALTTIIKNGKVDHKIIIYTDSQYSQNIINYDIWQEGWIISHANLDLTSRIKDLCSKFPNNLGIEAKNRIFRPDVCRNDKNQTLDWPLLSVHHCYSHKKKPSGGLELEIWAGNDKADELSKKK